MTYLVTHALVFLTALIIGTINNVGGFNLIEGQEVYAGLGLSVFTLAASINRAHDIGRSGWFAFVPFISIFISAILLLILDDFIEISSGAWPIFIVMPLAYNIFISIFLLFKKGDSGPNGYGDEPPTLRFFN